MMKHLQLVTGLLVLLLATFLTGCTIGHQKFYGQVAPTKYPPTDKVMVFEYANVNLSEIYELLFNDFLVVGKSNFNGPYEDPSQSVSYAKSIGADVFITSSQFKETRTSFMNLSTPTTSTTYMSGYSGSGSFYGTATTYGTKTTTIPVSVNRYDQDGMYLRNVNKVTPLWERSRDQYQKTSDNSIDGIWKNENYEIELFQSGNQIVAFIKGTPKELEVWKDKQLKFVYGLDSKVGIYLMGNKTPMPSSFEINKFGHLEIRLLTNGEKFSFARKIL